MTKLTIADKFDEVVKALNGAETVLSHEELVDFINDRKDKATKKSANRKLTAQQKENEELKNAIVDGLSTDGATVTDLMKSIPALEGLSNQRVSALLRQLVIDGKAVKTKEGKKSLFAIAE